jgi:hypothetical protein
MFEKTQSEDSKGNFHYVIPMNNDKAMKLASLALNRMGTFDDRRVVQWEDHSKDKLAFLGIKTIDQKGRLSLLSDYEHSQKWEKLGVLSDINEIKQCSSGGTLLRGSFKVTPESFNGVSRLTFQTHTEYPPSEVKEAYDQYNDAWKDIQQTVNYAQEESANNAREEIANKQHECNHEHAVIEDDFVGRHSRAEGYCEDCGAEITSDKELAF